jgi:hypothetical protein
MDPADLLTPSVLVPVAVVVVLLVGVGIGVFKVMAGKKAAEALQQWTKGAFSLWTGGEDCGAWPEGRAKTSLANWYGATGPGKFWEVVSDLRSGTTGNVAWDRVRALDLLRIGFAARFIDADQCWTEAAKIGTELQSKYRSWEDLAQVFEAGMQNWQRSRGVTDPNELGRVQRHLPALRAQIWPRVAWGTRLASDD